MSIKVKDYKWKKKMLVAGHYEFEIEIPDSTVIFRRFSQIEKLRKKLINLNPGCRIPKLPEKSIWLNLGVNNILELKKRLEQVEIFLNYVYRHKYLSENQFFKEFLSDDFLMENSMNESGLSQENSNETPNKSLMGKIYGFANYYLGGQKRKQSNENIEGNYIKEDSEILIAKDNFLRLSIGLKEFIKNFKEHIEINANKIKTISNIYQIARDMKYNGLEYKVNNNSQFEENESNDNSFDEVNSDIKKLNKNINLLNDYCEKNREYQSSLEKDYLDKVIEYQNELDEIIEIFQRKEQYDYILIELQNKYKNDNSVYENLQKQISFNKELNTQLKYEIKKFKQNREKNLVEFMNKFYLDKYDNTQSIQKLFQN